MQTKFLDGWPNDLRSEVRVKAVHKIKNASLESRYQQFVHSNPKFANRECIGWHGTSAKCHDGHCMSPLCSLCQIVRNGFKQESARKNTYSHDCWGDAVYFATQSFVCHTFNGASQLETNIYERCTIMAKLNPGHTAEELNFHRYRQTESNGPLPRSKWIKENGYDTVTISRDYYIAPTDYILVFNNTVVLPTYIVLYSFEATPLRIRKHIGDYCLFHNEYHKEGIRCDGVCHRGCLGYDQDGNEPGIRKYYSLVK